VTPAVNQCHFFLRCDFFKHLLKVYCDREMAQCIWSFCSGWLNVYKVSSPGPAMCMEFCLALANVYKVFARTGSMYMEFWLALGNVYKVLMATIEHPLPLSGT
ncbi:MAG: hypothetical protein EAZ74_07050, partial [Alphaproteobacteria bacterium]